MSLRLSKAGAALPVRAGTSEARAHSRADVAAPPRPRRASGRTASEVTALPAAHVAVVGAGLAGLAAALELKRHGFRVTLLERSRLLGGKTTSFPIGDVEMDSGQHAILGCYTSFLELTEELGMRGDLRLQERFDVVMLSDRGRARLRALRLPAPLHLALPFLRCRALTLRARLQVPRALLAARRRHRDEEERTFADWLSRHGQGEQARRGFWEPFLIPALNAPFDRVSAAAALMVVRTALLGNRDAARIGLATVPLARFAERAAERCDEVRLRTPVTGLVVEGGRLRGLRAGDAEIGVDAAVLAVPPDRLLRFAGADALGVTGLDRFVTQPIVDVHLWYDRGPADLDFAAVIGSPVQWIFAKGPGYVCCSLSSAEDLILQPEERLVALADGELRARLPELDGARLLHGVAIRDPEATFVPAPGLHRPGPATALDNAVLAGCWTDTGWPATMEGAVRSGRQAARTLIDSLVARHA
ncbi:MAG: hydroxysqualene dehydroxylase HpnE [Candidatus Dormibacteria bacterium]